MNNGLEHMFRNLLIGIAREAKRLSDQIAELEGAIAKAQHVSRRNALRSLRAERIRQRSRLNFLLSKNAEASRHFFGTVDSKEISCEQFLFAEKV